jgi:hypothetical protein
MRSPHSEAVVIVTAIVTGLAVFAVALRQYAQYQKKQAMTIDAWLLCSALVRDISVFRVILTFLTSSRARSSA